MSVINYLFFSKLHAKQEINERHLEIQWWQFLQVAVTKFDEYDNLFIQDEQPKLNA